MPFSQTPKSASGGRERAVDAQRRIVAAVGGVLARARGGDVAIVSHGAVGTLLKCHLAGRPISRSHDQPSQGHFWVASLPELRLLSEWRPLEDAAAAHGSAAHRAE